MCCYKLKTFVDKIRHWLTPNALLRRNIIRYSYVIGKLSRYKWDITVAIMDLEMSTDLEHRTSFKGFLKKKKAYNVILLYVLQGRPYIYVSTCNLSLLRTDLLFQIWLNLTLCFV